MPRGGAHFSSEELARVLSHYDVGVINEVKPLSAGSRRVPKVMVTSEKGKFLLKRRRRGKDDIHRVAFAHAVQTYLAKKRFPVAVLVPTRAGDTTILQLNNHVYEFFEFVTGARYDGSPQATIDTGRYLAKLHRCLSDFVCEDKFLTGSFHDSTIVRRHLRTVGSAKTAEASKELRAVAGALLSFYNDASIRVSKHGFDSWQQQVVHGDWHPGNMLFSGHKLTAVVDFDSVSIAPPVTDLANGMLQFSIVGGRPNPADWPDYFDQAKLLQFLNGYRQVAKLDRKKLRSLLDLMVETMIAEAVLPIAATGFFGNLSGLDFLKMIRRKAEWLNNHRTRLTHAMGS